MANDRHYQVFSLKSVPAPNFLMTALELKDFINFEVKRVYFLSKPINDKKTGQHCHIKDEDELFVMVAGSCTMILDDGHGLEEVTLKAPITAVRVPHLVWHGFKDMSDDAVIMAVSSTNYDPTRADYCQDHDAFLELLAKKES